MYVGVLSRGVNTWAGGEEGKEDPQAVEGEPRLEVLDRAGERHDQLGEPAREGSMDPCDNGRAFGEIADSGSLSLLKSPQA